jgi:pyrimidine-nucleoside phosphorylase
MYDVIKKKRDGNALTNEEIQFFVDGYTDGSIPDYQASAFIMALFLNNATESETIALTKAMMHSGDVVDLSPIKGIKVDKHSTGGVGDTTTLVLAPLVASVGVPIAKMSGRGLGHTGGTIDKLEAIPGFHVELTVEEFMDAVNKHQIAVIGQSKNIAPADKKLYALRDVTATVDHLTLIASSIMSKKLAAGSDGIVLDVKTGSGAFIKTLDGSIELANEMVKIGNGMGRETIGVITDMAQPLGLAIGNGLEVIEAINTLKGNGPKDLTDLCLTLGAHMVVVGKMADSYEDAYKMLEENIINGKGLAKFKEFISTQGGNPAVVDDYSLLPTCKFITEVKSEKAGFVEHFESEEVGISAMILGAGRKDMSTPIDLGAGIVLNKKIGDQVEVGDILATFYTNDESSIEDAKKRFLNALFITNEQVEENKLIQAVVTKNGITRL